MDDARNDFRAAIVAALGHAPEQIEPGRLLRFSTSSKRGDTAGWCLLFEDLRAGIFGCHRQGLSSVWSATERGRMTPAEQAALQAQVQAAKAQREAAQRQQWHENAQRIDRLWAQCHELVPGDPVTRYLKRRLKAAVWPLPACLRYAHALPYWCEGKELGRYPAMVVPLVSLAGKVVALHRTYLTADGRKADVPQVKKLTGACASLAGTAIALHQPDERGVIGVAEGIETALAAWLASGVPTVACYSAGGIKAYAWPREVQRIVVFADHDEAGMQAAQFLQARAAGSLLRCDVLAPRTKGADWADVWAAREGAELDRINDMTTGLFESAHHEGGR